MNKILVLFAVSLFALLYSCSDDAQRNQSDNATLYLNVQDARDGSLLAGAKATFGTTESTTDSKGLAKFKLKAGTQVLLVEKENYASLRKVVGANNDVASNGASIVLDIYENIKLYPTTAELKGVVYYKDSKGQNVPMPGVPIRIDITGLNLATTSYSCGTTDSNGEYVCKNLPAVSTNYRIYALGAQINGINYPVKDITPSEKVSLSPGVVSSSARTDYSAAAVAFILMEKPADIEDVNKGLPLTLKFSEAVDVSLFRQDWVVADQAVNIKWEACDGKACTQLKLTPLPNWLDGSYIGLSGIKSISGQTLNDNFIITVLDIDISDAKVEGVAFTGIDGTTNNSVLYNSTQAKITWNKLPGATEYEVFAQVFVSDTSSFVLRTTNSGANDTVAIIYFSNGSLPIGGKVVKVVVRASNGRGKSKFSDPISIKATDDGTAPTYANASTPILDICAGYKRTGTSWDYGICIPGYLPGYNYSDNDLVMKTRCGSVASSDGIINFCENSSEEKSPEVFASDHNLSTVLSSTLAYDRQKIPGVANPVIAYGRVFFNKPMKTTPIKATDITCAATPATGTACNKLKLAAEWNNDQNLGLTVTTAAGNVVTDVVNITYSIANLVGQNDVAFLSNNTSGTKVNAVKIKFVATPDGYCNAGGAGITNNDYTNCMEQLCKVNYIAAQCTGFCETASGKGSWNEDTEVGVEGDYTHCASTACPVYPNNATCKSDYGDDITNWYCWLPVGQADLPFCHNQYCIKNGWQDWSLPECRNEYCANFIGISVYKSECAIEWCDAYGSEDEEHCHDDFCEADPTNDLCTE